MSDASQLNESREFDLDSLYFIVENTPEAIDITRGERNSADTGGGWGSPTRNPGSTSGRERQKIPMDKLKAQMDALVKVVNQMFSNPNTLSQPGLDLEEIELSVEVNGQGNLSILGTGGTIGGKGGITLKFKRKSEQK